MHPHVLIGFTHSAHPRRMVRLKFNLSPTIIAMLTPSDIAEHGERHVERWLTDQGYRCYHNSQRQGTRDLEARSTDNNMLVHVLSHLESVQAPALGQSEHDSVCSRAFMLGFDAWLAEISINRHGEQAGDIHWKQLG